MGSLDVRHIGTVRERNSRKDEWIIRSLLSWFTSVLFSTFFLYKKNLLCVIENASQISLNNERYVLAQRNQAPGKVRLKAQDVIGILLCFLRYFVNSAFQHIVVPPPEGCPHCLIVIDRHAILSSIRAKCIWPRNFSESAETHPD